MLKTTLKNLYRPGGNNNTPVPVLDLLFERILQDENTIAIHTSVHVSWFERVVEIFFFYAFLLGYTLHFVAARSVALTTDTAVPTK